MKSLILFLAVFSLWACSSQNEGDVLSSGGEKTTLQLAMQYTETSRFDSLVLHGEGADTIHLQIQDHRGTGGAVRAARLHTGLF